MEVKKITNHITVTLNDEVKISTDDYELNDLIEDLLIEKLDIHDCSYSNQNGFFNIFVADRSKFNIIVNSISDIGEAEIQRIWKINN